MVVGGGEGGGGKGGGDGGGGEGGDGGGGGDGSGGEAPVARVAAAANPQLGVVAAAIGEERAEEGHGAEDGGQHEQHAHAELDQGLILVADLRWKEARRELGIGAGLEGAQAPAGQRPLTGAAAVPRGNSVRRNRARKRCQLGTTFSLAAGGGRARG